MKVGREFESLFGSAAWQRREGGEPARFQRLLGLQRFPGAEWRAQNGGQDRILLSIQKKIGLHAAVSVRSGVTPCHPPVISADAVCEFGAAQQGAGFPLWKVCSGAECKPSLCSGRGQWPPGTTLLWGRKPSLAAMDRWDVRPGLASACELRRQVGNHRPRN